MAEDRELREKTELLKQENAARKGIVDTLTQFSQNSGQYPEIGDFTSALSDQLGGMEKLAEIVKSEIDTLRGVDLPQHIEDKWKYKPEILHKYLKLAIDTVSNENKARKENTGWSDLSEEDMQLALTSASLRAIESDEEFRERMTKILVSRDPALVYRILSESGFETVEASDGGCDMD